MANVLTPSNSRRVLLGTLAAAVFLTGCGQSSSGQAATAAGYLANQDLDAIQQIEYQRFRDQQLAVQQCMQAEGFDFTVPDPARFLEVTDGGFVETSMEQATTFGYGISMNIGTAPTDGAPDGEGRADGDAGGTYVDPNDEMLASLSESERRAWSETYYGIEGDGCMAAGRTIAVELTDNERVQQAFADELTAMIDSIGQDPSIVAGEQSWVDCMAEQGFDYRHPTEAVRLLQDEFAAGIPDEQLADFHEREIAIATADAGCPFNNFGGWELAYEDLLAERQKAFADEHEAEILALIEQES
jgi:hypothetical protein